MSGAFKCPVCGSPDGSQFLTRPQVPVHQHLLLRSALDAKHLTRGDLKLTFCECCGFVTNTAFDPSKLGYGADYDNSQDCSAMFADYVGDLAARLASRTRDNAVVVEVGCGKGTFLRRLVEAGKGKITGHGFDPSYEGPLEDLEGRLRFSRGFLAEDSLNAPADMIVCRHVIEHVDRPASLLETMRAVLVDSPGARLFLETPSVDWILDHHAIWDFFYEHCSYFGRISLDQLLVRTGFSTVAIEEAFGGQYLWAEAALSMQSVPECEALSRRAPTANWEDELIRNLKGKVAELASNRTLALWGAGAKGITFANLLDPDASLFRCIVDLNPRKQGLFAAGTGHPIVDFTRLAEFGVDTCLVMNPLYLAENRELVGSLHEHIDLVDVMEWNNSS